jgi:GWxTD domain-containing protein
MKNLLLAFLISSNFIFTQSKFDFEFDYAQFAYDSTSNYLELYYSFNQSSLKISAENSHTIQEALLKIFIKNIDTNDTLVFNQWQLKHDIDTVENSNQVLVGTLGFIVPSGSYSCYVKGSDVKEESMFREISEEIKVVPFLSGSLGISDIQLASKMIQGSENTNSIFYKNTFEVIPNPNVLYGENQPALFFYSELYNLLSPLVKSDNLKLSQMIYNSKGKLVKEKTKYFLRNTATRVEVGSYILSNYPTDTYTLILAVIDSAGSTGISTAKKFFVYNPKIVVVDSFETSSTSVLASTFGTMSEEELDDLFEKCKYIAAKSEIEKFQKLSNLDGKREYMFEFWKNRDMNNSSGENEFYKDYVKKVQVANERYTRMGREGWKTDRGRVYLIYGEPSEVERYPNQSEAKPYEIWHYNDLEGGVYFVFADLTGFLDYVLVTSTKRGEIRDDNWYSRILVQ